MIISPLNKLQKGEPMSPTLTAHVTVFKDDVAVSTLAGEIALAVENSKRDAARAIN
jgi:hypothetical protein